MLNKTLYFKQTLKNYNSSIIPYLFIKNNKIFNYNFLYIYKLLNLIKKTILEIKNKNGKILFVTNLNNKLVNEKILSLNYYYLNNYWYGGLLTNWSNFKLKIEKINLIKEKLTDYTIKLSKKEINMYNKKIELFNKYYKGIKNMIKLPDLIIFTNYDRYKIGINESLKLGIPYITFIDLNTNLNKIPYFLPLNIKSNKIILNLLNYFLNKIIL
jgi:small subunit ribosomal protein S2